MNTSTRVRCVIALVGLAAAGLLRTDLLGYVTNGHVWGTTQVVYYVNPNSSWVSPSAAISAFQQAADSWDQQTQANVRLVYGGPTSGAALTLNYKNEVFFRNDSAGGTVAETYWWWDGSGKIIDADMVLHDGGFQFSVGSGCTNGVYVEDVAVHEFGHALGLGHSADPTATMYYAMPSYCDQSQLVLEQDDIDGLESLYPPTAAVQPPSTPSLASVTVAGASPTSGLVVTWSNVSNEDGYRIQRSADGVSFAQIAQVGANVVTYTNTGLAAGTTYYYRVAAYNSGGSSNVSNVVAGQTQVALVNTAPSVSITNPVNNASYPQGAAISFVGTANDTQDGNLSSNLQWTSSLDGAIGAGGSFSRVLSVGTHTIRATVKDSGNLSSYATATLVVTSTASGPPSLSARSYRNGAVPRVDLTWSGAQTASVSIVRNGTVIRTTANDGVDTDSPPKKGGTFTYTVCNTGSSVCSNQVTVTF